MTVAVAYSDTPRGEAALKAAAEEATLRGQDLAVLNIIAGVDEVYHNDPAVEKHVADVLAGVTDLTWNLHTAPEEFDTSEALLEQAEEVKATLLVMGSRKRRPIGKLILGSVVQRVLLESQIPVLVVKAE